MRWTRTDTMFLSAILAVLSIIAAIGYTAFKSDPETGAMFILAVLVGVVVSGGKRQ